jgi:hypothetical protein
MDSNSDGESCSNVDYLGGLLSAPLDQDVDSDGEPCSTDVDYLGGVLALENGASMDVEGEPHASNVEYLDWPVVLEPGLEIVPAATTQHIKVFNAPSQRGPADHHGICAKMREAKERRRRKHLQAQVRKLSAASQPLGRKNRKFITGRLVVSLCQDATKMSNISCGTVNKVSDRTVRRCLQAGAYARLSLQDHLLRSLDGDDKEIDFATSSLAWDGTEQKLRMPDFGPKLLFMKSARGTFKVMVSAENLGIGYASGHNVVVRLIRPCIPMFSATTATTYNGLFRMRCLKEIELTKARLMTKAKIMDFHFDTDGDGTNYGIIDAHRGALRDLQRHGAKAVVTSTAMTCGNHRTALTDNAVVDMLGSRFTMGASHRYALLMRMGPNLIRLHSACVPVLQSYVLRCPEAERPEPHPYNLELVDYLLAVYVGTTKTWGQNNKKVSSRSPLSVSVDVDDGTGPRWTRTKAGQAYYAFLFQVVRMFPAPWHQGLKMYGDDSIEDGAKLVQQFCYQKLVPVPSSGKWFKTGPCLDALLSHSSLGVFVPLLLEAFKNNKALKTQFTCTVGDVAYIEEISWHQVHSVRIEQTINWGKHPAFHFKIAAWAILKEPQRQIHMEFIVASSENGQKEFKRPKLCDFVSRRRSVISLVLAYYSSLITSRNPSRLLLICQGESLASWKKAAATKPLADTLRHSILVTLAWTKRRHEFLQKPPWTWAVEVDDRCSMTEIQERRDHIMGFRECRLDVFFSKVVADLMKEDSLARGMIRSSWWPRFLTAKFRGVRMAMGPIECRHGQNKANCDSCTSWALCSAKYCHREGRAHIAEYRRMLRGGSVQDAEDESVLADCPKEKQFRVLPTLCLFHQACMRRDKGLGIKFNPASTLYWDGVRQEFEALPLEDRIYFEEQRGLLQDQKRREKARILQIADLPHDPGPAERALVQAAGSMVPQEPEYATVSSLVLTSGECARAGSQQDLGETIAPLDVLRCGRAHGGFRGMVSKFKALVSQTPSGSALPKPFLQQGPCTSVCLHHDAFQIVNMRDMIVKWSRQEAARRTTRTCPLSVQRLLYGFNIDGQIFFGLLTSGSLQAGRFQSRQNWIVHKAAPGVEVSSDKWSTGAGILLRIPRTAFEQSLHPLAQQSPFSSVECGEIYAFAEQDFADELVSHGSPCRYVVIKKFLYELDDDDDTLEGIVTVKLDDSFEPVRLETATSTLPMHDPGDMCLDEGSSDEDIDYLRESMANDLEATFAAEDAALEQLDALLSQESMDLLSEMRELDSGREEEPDDGEMSPPPPLGVRRAGVPLRPPISSDSLEYRRASALSIPSNSREVYDLLEVFVLPSWHIIDKNNKRLGVIRPIQAHLMQMTCDAHPKCRCSLKSERVHEVEAHLVKWLCTGPSHASQESHYAASEPLRLKYNRR